MKTVILIFINMSLIFCCKPIEKLAIHSGSHLKLGFPSDPVNLDPIFSTDLTTEKILPLLYSTLFRLDQYGNPKPHLTKNYNWDSKNRKLEIVLHDNSFLGTVQDSLNRLINTPGPRRENYKNIRSIHIQTNLTIAIFLSTEKSLEDTLISLSLPPASIQGNTGPYTLKDWKKGNYLHLVKNKKFSIPNQSIDEYPDTIEIVIIPQSTSGLFLFTKGQLDSIKLSDFLLSSHITKDKQIIEKKGRSVQYIAINNTNPCFDIHFRQAVNLAIDRKKIISTILENNAELTIASIPSSRLDLPKSNQKNDSIQNTTRSSYQIKMKYDKQFSSESTDPNKKKIINSISYKSYYSYINNSYNFDHAKTELSKSHCYPSILDREIDLRMRADDENKSKGRAVAEYLRSIGLKVKVRGMEKAPLYKENGEKKGDLTFLTWYADYPSPLAFLDPVFHSLKHGNGGNRSFYSNPELDQLITNKKIHDSIEILIRDKPWIFLWSIHENYLVSDKLLQFPRILDYL